MAVLAIGFLRGENSWSPLEQYGRVHDEVFSEDGVPVIFVEVLSSEGYWGPLQSRPLETSHSHHVANTGNSCPSLLFLTVFRHLNFTSLWMG